GRQRPPARASRRHTNDRGGSIPPPSVTATAIPGRSSGTPAEPRPPAPTPDRQAATADVSPRDISLNAGAVEFRSCGTSGAPLVSPPVALAFDVFARSVAEIGRADDEDLEAVRPGLVASPRTGRDAHRVPFLELDVLVVDLHAPAPAHDHVPLLLRLVRVAVRKAIAGWDVLVAQGGFLERERLGRRAELQVRRAVELGADVLQILLEVPERERHAAILWRHL